MRDAGRIAGIVGAMAVSSVATVFYAPRLSRLLSDFYGNVWWPGHRILHGAAGFPDTHSAWPPPATATFAPLALLPEWAAVFLWVAGSVAAFGWALWLVGCRDWRAYAVGLASPPVLCCLVLGNMTLLLVAGVAVVWVCRDRRPVLAGSALGAMILLKLWLWPVVVFLLLTRRLRAALSSAVWVGVGTLVWWLVSRDTLYGYHDVTTRAVEGFAQLGMGIVSIVVNDGGSLRTAQALAFVAGLGVLAIAWRASADLTRFTLCLAAGLVASPIVWTHYYAILFVPIALRSPRLSGVWLVPYITIGALLWPTIRLEFIVASAACLAAVAIVCIHVARPNAPHKARQRAVPVPAGQ